MAPKTLSDLKRKDLFQTKGYINESWVDAASGKTFDVYDPATLDKIATLPEMGAEDTNKAIEAAHEAFQTFKKTSARQRARWLRKWSDLCLENIDDLALILTLENGKTLVEAKGEVTYAASFLEWFAGEAERVHGEVVPTANLNQRILTFKQPIGVAACLAPWNFPIAMITRKVGAALAAGCTTVWKPAGETPLSSLAQAVLAHEAGFPKGTINVITTLNLVNEVGEALCKSSLVRKLSFTGSTRVGKLLARQCSDSLKKLSLELGGNSPFIVFDDAKLETAVEACILAKFRNSGQTCVTANRIFVQKGIYAQFAEALAVKIKSLKVGPGTEDGVFKHGGQVILGGEPMKDFKGYFLQPTIIKGMNREMITTREEIFAPVVGLYEFETEDDVIRMANDCNVGLGSFICTENIPRAFRVTEALEVGMVGVNLGLLSACESPFGGVKESGYGREGGRQGIEEYLSVKSMLINVAN
ncbi:succinate-semialdehyde dehydrogenase (NADP+) [Cladophialophora psammophila CBS 110553]|uniref:Succinate-semialdehyde dehydrogenase (NADP+) n=1 Tax=Cladophialophora psammophila CBS 110553 TaxID=1182543 RepID=W9WEM0_9EURO|nr:succinate-semialdehyde dehydrogenase (NADP+) [Cladophialophora psammophila CBS 110553]EXJ66363.1 succinate-semialdehyde dehydrogenase (NADP+) [Cladophialophora psammophila CBS 110553]